MSKRCFALIALFVGQILAGSAAAADKWSIGFNEPFIAGHMQVSGECTDCPTNSYLTTLPTINSRLQDLAANRHVGMFREIIPLSALRPTATTNNYDTAIDVLSIYQGYNLNVVVTFGLPLPPWMTVSGSTWLVMPDDDASWTTLKNTLSNEMGSFVSALWNSPRMNRTWMQEHLYIEGFNEFDSLQTLSGQTNKASPARAADLQNGIQFTLNALGLPIQTLMPSVVGAYTGYSPMPANLQAQYMHDYYQAGGSGLPNAHIYVRNDTADQGYTVLLGKLRSQVQAITSALPTSLQGQLVIGETGAADRLDPYCTASSSSPTLAIDQRDQYYAAVAADPTINSQVSKLIFWRLMNLPPSQIPTCEAFYGVVNYDNSSYKNIGLNLFNYLSQ
jgi:hypothetical protein